MENSDIKDLVFRQAVDAIDRGDILSLSQILETNPSLVNLRLDKPTEGYFAHPYLLWFIADNPIRNKKLAPNIVEITQIIIKALKKNPHDSYQYQVDYTMGLVATGRIPRECAVQLPLMELLINEGAKVKRGVLGPIGQNNFEAARYLLSKGATYNLATAVALDNSESINGFLKNASASELYVALVVASFFGKVDMISQLINAGADPNGNATREDFGGFHSHASTLHQAVSSGSIDAVKLLVHAGANLHAKDKIYDGTPLEWAEHMKSAENDENKKKKYREIEDYLLSIMNEK